MGRSEKDIPLLAMHPLIFASNNPHKVAEIKPLMPSGIQIITLSNAGIDIDIAEPHATLEENAAEKSQVIYNLTHLDCFSEDTGLEVSALNGEPGVKSARYAGEPANHDANINLLLKNLKGVEYRRARFRTVISLRWKGQHYLFEGVCSGTILPVQRGDKGFGYDSVFMPDGSHRSFAEMELEEKSKYSHRTKALSGMIAFLQTEI